jgi:hypothetical protein
LTSEEREKALGYTLASRASMLACKGLCESIGRGRVGQTSRLLGSLDILATWLFLRGGLGIMGSDEDWRVHRKIAVVESWRERLRSIDGFCFFSLEMGRAVVVIGGRVGVLIGVPGEQVS